MLDIDTDANYHVRVQEIPLFRRFLETSKHLNHCIYGQLPREHLMEVRISFCLYIIWISTIRWWWICRSTILQFWIDMDGYSMQFFHFLKEMAWDILSRVSLKSLQNITNSLCRTVKLYQYTVNWNNYLKKYWTCVHIGIHNSTRMLKGICRNILGSIKSDFF